MAQFDLKKATLYVRDGFSASGHLAAASGYDPGVTEMAVDNFIGAVATGDKLTVAGNTQIYTITSHTETLGNTTDVVFTPPLVAAAADNAVVTFYDANADLAAVNNVGGYAVGATVITVGSFVGVIATGDKVMFAGDPTIYSVSAHTETLGNTTSITIQPLVQSVVNTQVITVYNTNADTALVNQSTPGLTPGETAVSISGITGALHPNDVFTLAGDVSKTKYKVLTHTETLGNTTGITFAPAIPAGVLVSDGAAITFGAHELEVKLGEGNLTYAEKRNFDYTLNRGKLDTVRQGNEAPIEVKLDATWEHITNGSSNPALIPTVEDAMKKRGNASYWVTAASDPCEPYAVNLVLEDVRECVGDDKEIITLPYFRHEQIDHDAKAGTLAFSGKCNVTEASVARVPV